jgi:hypothetical protein
MRKALTLALVFFSWTQSLSALPHYRPGKLGEYYEYDVEGTPKERARRRAKHRVARVIKTPIKYGARGAVLFAKAMKKSLRRLEEYLHGPMSDSERAKLGQALTDWETAMGAYPKRHDLRKPEGLSYVPIHAWRLFKYSLYKVGFSLPRSIKRAVKKSFYHTFGGLSAHVLGHRD